MSYNPNQNHTITLAEGEALTENFRNAHPNEVKGYFFGRDAIQTILDQPGCVGLKMYYGLNNGVRNLVIVGTTADANDQYTLTVLDNGIEDPPSLSQPNPLNS